MISCKWLQLRVKIERLSNYTDIGKLLLPLGPWPSVISASYAYVWSIQTSVLNEFFDSTLYHPASTIIDRYSVSLRTVGLHSFLLQ